MLDCTRRQENGGAEDRRRVNIHIQPVVIAPEDTSYVHHVKLGGPCGYSTANGRCLVIDGVMNVDRKPHCQRAGK